MELQGSQPYVIEVECFVSDEGGVLGEGDLTATLVEVRLGEMGSCVGTSTGYVTVVGAVLPSDCVSATLGLYVPVGEVAVDVALELVTAIDAVARHPLVVVTISVGAVPFVLTGDGFFEALNVRDFEKRVVEVVVLNLGVILKGVAVVFETGADREVGENVRDVVLVSVLFGVVLHGEVAVTADVHGGAFR